MLERLCVVFSIRMVNNGKQMIRNMTFLHTIYEVSFTCDKMVKPTYSVQAY